MPRQALSTMEVAERCGVHYTTIRRWILQGSLSAYETPGGHHRILKEDLDAFIALRKLRARERIGGKLRVLAVDDDEAFRDSVVEFFSRDARLDVREAEDGFTAGRFVEQFQPDVVILDLLMPGLDGFEVCRKIKDSKRLKHTRILVLTGYATEENIRKARECGADVCLAKPMGLDELKDEVLRLGRSVVVAAS